MANRVVQILMERDNMTEKEAKRAVEQVRTEVYLAVEDGNYDEAEEIMMSLLGLEMDYLFDII
jgi:uncharacterized NAD-dependent epimerase/dehydratase family protein